MKNAVAERAQEQDELAEDPCERETAALAHESLLISRSASGDQVAFTELVRAYERLAFRTAYLIAGAAGAEEATQNAFIKAHKALKRFTPGKPFRPWLMQIVINEARSVRRSANRHRAIANRALATMDPTSTVPSAAAVIVRHETDRALHEAIARLSAKHQEVVTCRYLLDLSEQETAHVLCLRPGTVKSRLSRALERLRVEMEQTDEPESPKDAKPAIRRPDRRTMV